jgi:MFS family permease
VGPAALLVAEAMNLLDSTIVQVAGPAIHADLGGPVSYIQWFSAAYTLAFALLLITGGRLGDIAGRRRVFRIGVTGFMLASLACALAPSAGMLIGFRVVQGAAAAVVIPQTFGLIRAMFDGDETAKALGGIGPVMGLAAICGPVLGSTPSNGSAARWASPSWGVSTSPVPDQAFTPMREAPSGTCSGWPPLCSSPPLSPRLSWPSRVGTSTAPLSATRRRRPPPPRPPTVSGVPASRHPGRPGAGGRMPGWIRSCVPQAEYWVSSCPTRSTWAAARAAPSCVVRRPSAAA